MNLLERHVFPKMDSFLKMENVFFEKSPSTPFFFTSFEAHPRSSPAKKWCLSAQFFQRDKPTRIHRTTRVLCRTQDGTSCADSVFSVDAQIFLGVVINWEYNEFWLVVGLPL